MRFGSAPWPFVTYAWSPARKTGRCWEATREPTPGSKQSGSGRYNTAPALVCSHDQLCFELHSINPGGPGAEPLAPGRVTGLRSFAHRLKALRGKIDVPQTQTAEPHRVGPGRHALQSHIITGQGHTHADPRIVDLQLPAPSDTPLQIPCRITQFNGGRVIVPCGPLIHFHGNPHSQCFVGTFLVERLPPDVQHRLLLPRSGCGRTLQLPHVPVHPLVRAVLLRMSRTDPVQVNPQRQPPGRQTRQTIRRIGSGKGCPVVAANDLRKTVFAEQSFHLLFHRRCLRALQGARTQYEPAEIVADGQWLEASPIPCAPPAFEVNRPDLIGALRFDPQLQSAGLVLRPPTALLHQARLLQHTLERALGGDGLFSAGAPQHLPQLARAPAGMRLLQRYDPAYHVLGQAGGTRVRFPRQVLQALQPLLEKSLLPLITRLPTDSVFLA